MKLNRLIAGTLSMAAAASLGFAGAAVTSLTTATPAAAASVADGQITRSEVLARAQNWVDRGVKYNQSRSASSLYTDVDGGHKYGPDCSGLVSMAWHITANSGKGGNSTYDFASWSGKEYLGSLHDLKPGDAILKSSHMELFARWKDSADHTKGAWTYSLNGTGSPDGNGWEQDWAKGPTANSHGQVGDESWSSMQNFRPIRYKNIVDDTQSPPPAPQYQTLGDFDGDGKKDIAGVAGSDLWIHRNTSSPGDFSTAGVFVSTGWRTVSKFMAGDFDGDGKDDIIGFNGGDELLIWRSTSTATAFSFAPYKSLGTGWGIFTQLLPLADYDGDGKKDIAGVAGSDLWIHRNTSSPGDVSTAGVFVSTGWRTVSKFMAGDFDGDGKDDIIGFNGGDELLIWRSTSTATAFGFAPYKSLGTGWGIFTQLLPLADYDGDGKKDIAGVAGSDLWIHRNTSTPGNFSTAGVFVSTGWRTVSKFLGADFDKDGKSDIIGFNGGDELLIWRSSSTATAFGFAPYKSLGTGWSIFGNKLLTSAPTD
ncbi:FG-GAP repeat domain-containing protein [Microbispora sp. H10949]|uniref:FG-GAP repeat domain-containing protein n=1 Tax=Microbispora sp. H10949 TaxID=2729111 RepID=UPI00160231ED|nr:VCBS repeat-containing protein [Microbispora sp. H10949]